MGNCEYQCCEPKQRFMELESDGLTPEQLALAYRNLLPENRLEKKWVMKVREKDDGGGTQKAKGSKDRDADTLDSDEKGPDSCSLESKLATSIKSNRVAPLKPPKKEVFSKTDLRIVTEVASVASPSKARLPPVEALFQSVIRHESMSMMNSRVGGSISFARSRSHSRTSKTGQENAAMRLLKESVLNLKSHKKARFCPNGDFYVGDWHSQFKKHGFGVFVWKDGSRLGGKWVQNRLHGFGKYLGADGSSYEGEWDAGVSAGHGEYRNSEGYIYVGHWKDDLQEGQGEECWPNGDIYQGAFQGGKKSGQGTMKFHDGSVFEGTFAENRIEGQGQLTTRAYRVSGDWRDGQLVGAVEFAWNNGSRFAGRVHQSTKRLSGVFVNQQNTSTALSNVPYQELWGLVPGD